LYNDQIDKQYIKVWIWIYWSVQ